MLELAGPGAEVVRTNLTPFLRGGIVSAELDRSEQPDISVVIACYDEAPHLEESVLEVIATLERSVWSAELVFVEDCSSDNTREVLDHILLKHGERMPMRVILHEHNTGRGRTVTDGMRLAAGRVIGFLDIDLEVHARYIPSLVRAIEDGADMAIAERIYRVSPSPGFLLRHVLSRGYRKLAARFLGLADLDSEAGFKFFDRACLKPLLDQCEDPGWFWDTEITALAQVAGLRIAQVPCLFLRRRDKRSTLQVLPATIDYLRKLVAFRDRLARLRGA